MKEKFKKIISGIISLTMLMAFVPANVAVAETEDVTNIVWVGGSYAYGAHHKEDTSAMPDGETSMPFAERVTNWYAEHTGENVNYHNVCIGGTTSMYGRNRFEKDVLSKDPDIIFIEFTGNDDYLDDHEDRVVASLEGMVRSVQLYEKEAGKDVKIVFTYRPYFSTEDGAAYNLNRNAIDAYHAVADYYGIYELDPAEEAKRLWEADGVSYSSLIAPDGYHPNALGQYYTGIAMINILEKNPITSHITRSLPMNLDYTEIIPTYVDASDSQYLDTENTTGFTQIGTYMTSSTAGDVLAYKFNGTSIGVISGTISALVSMWIDGERFTGWTAGNTQTQSHTQALEPGEHTLEIRNEGGALLTIQQLIVDGIANEGILGGENYTQNVYENDCTSIESDDVLTWETNLIRSMDPAGGVNYYSNLYFDYAVGVYGHSLDKKIATIDLTKLDGYSNGTVFTNVNARFFEYGTAGSPTCTKNIVVKAVDADGNVLKEFRDADCSYQNITSYGASWRMYDYYAYNIPIDAVKLEIYVYNSSNTVLTNVQVGYSTLEIDDVKIDIPSDVVVDENKKINVIAHANTGYQYTPEMSAATYSSSNESVATVDGNGLITGLSTGTTEISSSVTVDGINYQETKTVNVYEGIIYETFTEWDASTVTKNANLMTLPMLQNNMAGSSQGATGTYSSDKSQVVYSISGKVSQDANRLYAGLRFNTAGEFFTPVPGTTYVCDMKVKNASTNGATPSIGMGMADNNGSSMIKVYPNEYGTDGMPLTDSENWMDFKVTWSLPSNYNMTASKSYAQRVWSGFLNGTGESGWAYAVKTDNVDDFYFSTEQIYDITNTIKGEAVASTDRQMTAEAKVLNQIGLPGGLEQDITWKVFDQTKTMNVTSSFEITKNTKTITVKPTDEAATGTYYLVANAVYDADTTMSRSVEFEVIKAAGYKEWDASTVTKNANLMTLPMLQNNMAGSSQGATGAYSEDKSQVTYSIGGKVSQDSNRLYAGLRFNTGGEFFTPVPGTTYVCDMKVKNASTNGATPSIGMGMADNNGSSMIKVYPNEYGTDGMPLTDSENWMDFKVTMSLPADYNMTTSKSYAQRVWSGFLNGTGESGWAYAVKTDNVDDFYFSTEQIYDITNTITSEAVASAGNPLTAEAKVLNQIGLPGGLDQTITWKVFDETKATDVTSSFEITANGNAVSVVPKTSVDAETYYLVANADFDEDTTMSRGVAFETSGAANYSDSQIPAKAANMIPDASDNVGVTYFSQRTDGDKFGYGWYKTDAEIEGYHAEFTNSGDGTLANAWTMVEGIVLNQGGANFGYQAEAGKTYVFSANVKNISPEGIYPALNLATNSTYSPNWGIVSNEYPDGYTLSSGWEKFNASFTITDDFLSDRGYPDTYPTSYKDRPMFGFVPGTATGAAFRLDVTEKDSIYFAEEQAYQIVLDADKTILYKGEGLEVNAKLLNQIGTTGSLSQDFEWVILDGERTDTVDGFTVTENGATVTISVGDSVNAGTYVALAKSTTGLQKGITFKVASSERYKDYEAPERTGNMIPDASESYGTKYFAQRTSGDGIVDKEYFKTDDTLGGNQFVTKYTYNGSGTLAEAWRGVEGVVLNQADSYFGYQAEAGKTYVFSANVKNISADGIYPVLNIATNSTYSPNFTVKSNEYPNGMTLSSGWEKFNASFTITEEFLSDRGYPDMYPTEFKDRPMFGFENLQAGAAFALDVSEKDSVYFAEEYVNDLGVSADVNTISNKEEITVTAQLLNQVGTPAQAVGQYEWFVLNTARTEVFEVQMEVSEDTKTASVVAENLPNGTYAFVAYTEENGGMFKGVEFTVDNVTGYEDYIPQAKAENMIPDATAEFGTKYFAQRTSGDGILDKEYFTKDDTLGGNQYVTKYTYNGSGTLAEAWRGVEGVVLNQADSYFGYQAEAGKTYVFSANVKNISADGIYPVLNIATNSTYSPNFTVKSNEYPNGMTLSNGWEKFNASFTITEEFLSDRGYPDMYPTVYKDRPVFGFENLQAGAAFALDVSEKDSVYFAEEQLYDIIVESDKDTLLIGQNDITLTAKVVNQVGTCGTFLQNFEWVALNSNKTEHADELTITQGEDSSTVTVSWDPETVSGQYVIAAVSEDYDGFIQTVTLNIYDELNELYVSTTGDDNNAGTQDSPLRTLEGAKNAVNALRASGSATGAIDVIFEEGTYYFTNSVVFDADDTQTNGAKVTYKAADGKKVVFKGSAVIDTTNATVVDETDENYERLSENAKGKVIKINLSQTGLDLSDESIKATIQLLCGTCDYPSLYLNGNEQMIAQWPNGDAEYTTFSYVSGENNKIAYTDSNPDTWAVDTNSWLGGYFMNDYAFMRMPVTAIDASAKTITVSTNETDGLTIEANTDHDKSMRWKAFNILEEIDIPSEWYIDKDTNTLYYYPVDGYKEGQLEVSVLEDAMINISEADNIGFEGIEFANTRGNAIKTENVENITVNGCTFKNIGVNAVMMTGTEDALTEADYWQNQYIDAAYNCEISDSIFYNIGGSAIVLDGGNVDTLTDGNNVFTNNIVNMAAQKIKNYQAVLIKGCGNKVTHNNISRAAFQAIRHYGNNHDISYNEIHNVIQETDDSGIIYCGRSSVQRGTVIAYNYLHDSYSTDALPYGHQVGIYWDDGQTGMSAHHNIIKDVNIDVYTNGVDNNFSNNTSINIKNKRLYFKDGDIAPAYSLPYSELYYSKYPHLEDVLSGSFLSMAKYTVIKNNLSVNGPSSNSIGTYTSLRGDVSGNSTGTDTSVFVDAAGQDFRHKTSTTLLNSSFDIDLIGVTNDLTIGNDSIGLIAPFNNETVEDSTVRFMWNDVFGATKYVVTVASDAEFANVIDTVESYYNFADITAPADGTYYWKVTAYNTSREFQNNWDSETYSFVIGEVAPTEDATVNVTITDNKVSGTIINNNLGDAPVVDIYVAEFTENETQKALLGVTLIEDKTLTKGQEATIDEFELKNSGANAVYMYVWQQNTIIPVLEVIKLR